MAKTNRRIEQVNDFLRNEVAQLIRQEQDELRLELVSVTEVQTSPDLRHAKVFISTLGGEKERDAAVATLRRHAAICGICSPPASPFAPCRRSISAPIPRWRRARRYCVPSMRSNASGPSNPPRLDDEPAPEPTEKASNPRARKRRTED